VEWLKVSSNPRTTQEEEEKEENHWDLFAALQKSLILSVQQNHLKDFKEVQDI
jgi:hypothetical protein